MGELKKFIKKKAKGVIAFEWIICCPIALVITFFSVMMLIFTIDYHLISKNASALVSDLNMGDKGYKHYAILGSRCSDRLVTHKSSRDVSYGMSRGDNHGLGRIKGTRTVGAIITRDSDSKFYNASKYFIQTRNINGGFTAPYCELGLISCRVYDENGTERTGFNTKSGQTESGDMVIVEVKYKFCGVFYVNITSFGFIN